MNDPLRLVEEGANDFEARLLCAGRRDALPAKSRLYILSALRGGGGLSASVAATAASTKASAWFASVGIGTWLSGAAVTAFALWTGVELGAHSRHAVHPPSAAAPSTTLHAAEDRPRTGGEAALSRENPPGAEPTRPAAVASSPPNESESRLRGSRVRPTPISKASTDPLSAELSSLDLARRALLDDDPGLALKFLDDYARRFTHRRLDAESVVLRIEALAAHGERARAARIAREFLARQANTPYARRVKSLIGETRGPSP